jgi:predicted RNA binding protein YcfA (HicA-like mRNA interferase family)
VARGDGVPGVGEGRLLAGDLANVDFGDFERLLVALGFELRRVRGSHCIYTHRLVPAGIAIQPRGGDAEPYQIRQLLLWVRRYNLRPGSER